MKPKPVSIQRRFVLMQAGAVALALWLMACALYLNLEIQGRPTASLQQLRTSLSLNTQIHNALDELTVSFWRTYYSAHGEPRPRYEENSRRVQELTAGYSRLQLSSEEQREVASLQEEEERYRTHTSELLAGERNREKDSARLRIVGDEHEKIQGSLLRITESQLRRMNISTVMLDRYTRGLSVLLMVCILFAVMALASFRYAHRRHLWGPLEELRQMVLQVRRGNLDVTGEIPANVELGSLVQAFLEMAAEVREMRHSLEEKVKERTVRLEIAHKELLQAAKLSSLGQLVSGVAHEINNPLTSILGFGEILLARPELNASLRPQVQTIREESLRLKNLVANLSGFARRAPHRTQRMDLRVVLDRLVDMRHYQLTANNIQVEYTRPPETVWVKGDPDQLLQVVLNLVLNAEQAIKDCRERGEIRLACGMESGVAWATVEDNGSGMSAEVQEHIFDPFFTTRPAGLGTGLGLSISHGIIQQHRGEISVESVLGGGTRIRISLPAPPEEPTSPGPPAIPMRDTAAHAPRVLVIDDELEILHLVSEALNGKGWQVTPLEGAAALEHTLESAEFELVICDLKMPGRTGVEVLRFLRREWPELARHFLLITGNLADAEKSDVELSSVLILQKPFSLARLREMAWMALDGSE